MFGHNDGKVTQSLKEIQIQLNQILPKVDGAFSNKGVRSIDDVNKDKLFVDLRDIKNLVVSIRDKNDALIQLSKKIHNLVDSEL